MSRLPVLQGLLLTWSLLTAMQPFGQLIAAEATIVWQTDFARAEADAEKRQVPLLVHFYATWCLPCSKMDRDVLKSADVKQLLGERFIGVKVDSDQHPELVKRFGIQMLPSDVIVDPTNGRVLMEKQGALNLNDYLSMTSRAEAKFQHALKRQMTGRQIPSDELAKLEDIKIVLGEPQPLIGLDGFSPVSLTKSRKWIRGSAEYAWDFQGVTYQLATREELLAFRQNPADYAPRLLGCDPVTLWETDRAVPGRTLYGAFFDDELYLFTSAENRKRFKANPARFMKTQHVLRIEQIDRTATLEGSHLKVADAPEIAVPQ